MLPQQRKEKRMIDLRREGILLLGCRPCLSSKSSLWGQNGGDSGPTEEGDIIWELTGKAASVLHRLFNSNSFAGKEIPKRV